LEQNRIPARRLESYKAGGQKTEEKDNQEKTPMIYGEAFRWVGGLGERREVLGNYQTAY
jgi:hypothetical protein